MEWPKKRSNNISGRFFAIIRWFLIVVIILVAFAVIRYTFSLLSKKDSDRGSLLLSYGGTEQVVVSADIRNDLVYAFFPKKDLEIKVPGGYGYYPWEGILRLSEVEKNPKILTRSVSWALSAPIDDYFLLKNDLAKYKSGTLYFPLKWVFSPPVGTIRSLGVSKRWFWYLTLRGRSGADLIIVKSNFSKTDNEDAQRKIFAENKFSKSYEGFFFDGPIRLENYRVRLYYQDYLAAYTLSRIWRGAGVRVVDLTKNTTVGSECVIKIAKNIDIQKNNKTTKFIKKFGENCTVRSENVEGLDVEVYLSPKMEDAWK